MTRPESADPGAGAAPAIPALRVTAGNADPQQSEPPTPEELKHNSRVHLDRQERKVGDEMAGKTLTARQMRCVALAASCFIAVQGAAGGADPLDGPVVTRTSGDYALVRIDLDREQGERLTTVFVPLRNGKPSAAFCGYGAAVALDVSKLQCSESAVRGTLKGARIGGRNAFAGFTTIELDLKRPKPGAPLSGTYRLKSGDQPAQSGAATARATPAAALRKANTCAEGAAWPSYRGPTANMIAGPQPPLVDDLARARPAWVGERAIPGAPGMMTRRESVNRLSSGGGATPIVADGRLFLWFHEANTELLDPALAERADARAQEGRPVTRAKAAVLADDVVICLDAATGALLWETRFPKSCLNNEEHKRGINNYSPAYADGKLVAVTGSGRLVGLDARTGDVLWKTARNEKYEARMQKAIQTKSYQGNSFGLRSYGFGLLAVDGTILWPRGGSLVALDPSTGEQRWVAKRVTGSDDDLAIWRHGDRTYIVASSFGGTSIVDLGDGSILYRIPCRFVTFFTSPVCVDDLLVGLGSNPEDRGYSYPKQWRAYRLRPEGAKQLWVKPLKDCDYSPYCVPIIFGKKAFFGVREGIAAVGLETGKELERVGHPLRRFGSGHLVHLGRRLLSVPDGKHGHTVFGLNTVRDDGSLELVQTKPWRPALRTTTSYHHWMTFPVVDGRLFIRGAESITCYDLRKPK